VHGQWKSGRTAYHLLAGEEAIAGKSIVLLEARQACSSTTGRNSLSDSP
jgi:hypothetical protein